MPTYQYAALDGAGKEVTGTMTAAVRAVVLEQIKLQGLYPVRVEEQADPTRARRSSSPWQSRVPQASVDAFTRQLANLLAAGVPLSRALRILSRQASRESAQAQWTALHEDVIGGLSLADALAKWPRSFPPVYIAMVRAGETGGFLEVVLEQIADFRAWEQRLKGKVRAALLYPAVLAVLAVGVLTFLMTYFIPRFSSIFADLGGNLPWSTRAVVALSHSAVRYAPLIVGGIVLASVVLRRLLATEAGRRFGERLFLRLPMAGPVAARFALVRFCRMLGTLLTGGVALVPALRVAREAIGNRTLSDTINQAVEQVQRGASLAGSLATAKDLFPGDVVEMVAVAEESSRLDKELLRLATSYDAELDRQLTMLVALVEPALLFVMASIVGSIVISMLLPIFTLQDLIK